jgi:hypothetical protein
MALRKWNRIVTVVSRDRITVIGQMTDDDSLGSTLVIDRVNPENISETTTSNNVVDGSVLKGVGIIGLLPLQGATYLGLITKSSVAGYIGDHAVWSIKEVEWIPVNFGINSASTIDQKHLSLVSSLFSSTTDFYFSYTYNVCGDETVKHDFRWNSYHTRIFQRPSISPSWEVHIMCGSFTSIDFESFGRPFTFSLICRRSSRFAGTRYRKRGLNWDGCCANHVESEQILVAYGPPHHVMKFKQVRGSVPLHWSQASHGLVPKPEIFVHRRDLDLGSTRKHFQNLLVQYGMPIKAVSLLAKGPNRTSESLLGSEYAIAVRYMQSEMNLTLDEFDLKSAVVGDSGASTPHEPMHSGMYSEARSLAERLVGQVGWTWVGYEQRRNQKGVIRTNCVDCLDRTNIFQYIVGLEVLSEQLIELGVLDEPLRPSWATGHSVRGSPVLVTDRGQSNHSLLPLIEEMFEHAGDQLSYQYAGTATHKKYASDSTPGSGVGGRAKRSFFNEIFISLGRHYSASFTDLDKQHSLNLFLGLYSDAMREVAVYEDVCNVENIDRWVHSHSKQLGVTERSEPPNSPFISPSGEKYTSLNAKRLSNVRKISFT